MTAASELPKSCPLRFSHGLGPWGIVDTRTGRRVSVVTFFTREHAEATIQHWRERDAKGGRPDVHDLMPYLAPSRVGEP